MKQYLLLTICSFLIGNIYCQKTSVFAISGQSASPFNWSDIRMVSSGENQLLFENGKSAFSLLDAYNNKEVKKFTVSFDQQNRGGPSTINLSSPTLLMSAATAYDKKYNRLFFATMHSGHLLWLDLNDKGNVPVFHLISNPILPNSDFSNEAMNITRMTIGADGRGYALSNDGNHLIQFTTGRKVVATDIGMLQDDPSNKTISIHNQCTGWGGDVVGDVSGKLILFSAGRNVFEIDVHSKIAKYLGSVKNLPAQFTVNGAAVDDDDMIILSSANVQDGFYKVSLADLTASKIKEATILNASDLASGNLLGHTIERTGPAVLTPLDVIGNDLVTVYPNPVRNKELRISFDKNLPGTFTVAVTDLQGRLIQNKKVYVRYKGQMEKMHFDQSQVSGFYMIKVTDVVNKEIFTGKIFVE